MTGYGKGVSERGGLRVTVELKAVNHRFLDLSIKLPKGFTFAEDLLRKSIKANFVRGHIDVYVNYEDNREDKAEVQIDYALARRYYEAAERMAELCGCSNNTGTAELLRMPEVVAAKQEERDEETICNLLEQACSEACRNLDAMRASEGALLERDLSEKTALIRALADQVEECAPAMVARHREKVAARMEEILATVPVDEARMLNEIAFYGDKVCVDEEVTRLRTHTEHFAEVVRKGGAVGKQLDFLIQEMNRESNTIGSKCCDIEVANLVLELKGTVEKIREQIQNVE